jgi:hypothetical protein
MVYHINKGEEREGNKSFLHEKERVKKCVKVTHELWARKKNIRHKRKSGEEGRTETRQKWEHDEAGKKELRSTIRDTNRKEYVYAKKASKVE